MTQVNRAVIETIPGNLYPDRCLGCYELHAENYGGTRLNKCAQCQHADLCKCRFVFYQDHRGANLGQH